MNKLYYNHSIDALYILYKDGSLEYYSDEEEKWVPSLYRKFSTMLTICSPFIEFIGEV